MFFVLKITYFYTMTEQSLFSLDVDIKSLLVAKERYHAEQIKFHTEKWEEVKKLIDPEFQDSIIKNTSSDEPIIPVDKTYFSGAKWETIILDYLQKVDEAKTIDILNYIKPDGYEEVMYRRKFIIAISQSLNKLKSTGKIVSEKRFGEKGDVYKKLSIEIPKAQKIVDTGANWDDDLPF